MMIGATFDVTEWLELLVLSSQAGQQAREEKMAGQNQNKPSPKSFSFFWLVVVHLVELLIRFYSLQV